MNDPILGDPAGVESRAVLDALLALMGTAIVAGESWTLGGWRATVTAIALGDDPALTIHFDAVCKKADASISGWATIGLDPSGWIVAIFHAAGRHECFYIERHYEEFEVWPEDSAAEAIDTGRIGKRCGWAHLEARHWPALASFADGDFITLEPAEPNTQPLARSEAS